jgi:hypothetical protein
VNGPRKYELSQLYCEPAIVAGVEKIDAEEQAKVAARVYQSRMVLI